MKKYQKQLLSLLAGTVLGYLLYYHFFMDVILLIAHEGFLYMIINIAMLLLSIVGCAAIIYLLLEKRVSRWMLVLLSVIGFGKMGEGFFRLTAFGSRENTIEAMERIINGLKK